MRDYAGGGDDGGGDDGGGDDGGGDDGGGDGGGDDGGGTEEPVWQFGGTPDNPTLPTDSQPELPCGGWAFEGSWANPETGEEKQIASSTETPASLEEWCASIWQQFNDYIEANGLTVTAAVINIRYYENASLETWDADQVFIYNTYWAAILRHYMLDITYCVES